MINMKLMGTKLQRDIVSYGSCDAVDEIVVEHRMETKLEQAVHTVCKRNDVEKINPSYSYCIVQNEHVTVLYIEEESRCRAR